MKSLNFLKLDKREEHTFLLLTIGSIFNGISLGVLLLQEFILRKTLLGSLFEITLLVMIQPVSNIFSIFFYPLSKKFKRKNDFFLLIAFVGKLILLLMLLTKSSKIFILVISVFYIFNTFMNPLFSNIMQLNFRKKNRGFVYGIVSSVSVLSTLVVSNLSGKLLDINDNLYKLLFSVSAVSGFLCCFIFSKVKIRKIRQKKIEEELSFLQPIKIIVKILKENKDFMKYEIFFFLYGIGYLIILPSIPVYFVDILKLDYSKISFIKGFLGQVGFIVFFPFVGFFLDRMNIFLYSSLTFFLLSFYPLFLLISSFIPNPFFFIYPAFLIFSISMSAVFVIWDLSSIHFAKDNDSSQFQNVHIFLTGVRGIIVPSLGYLILKFSSPKLPFFVSNLFFLFSSFGMFYLFKKFKSS
ncbi:MAG: MFS transporter [bacterium]|nr:MFS transporter [bacterium]